jgi:D-glycero-D-manno-heptose 1,7-bisphosphate phosphatase
MTGEIAGELGSIAVFLDRDGTLIEEVDYLERVEQVTLYSWSIDGVRLLNRAGVLLLSASSRRCCRNLPV